MACAGRVPRSSAPGRSACSPSWRPSLRTPSLRVGSSSTSGPTSCPSTPRRRCRCWSPEPARAPTGGGRARRRRLPPRPRGLRRRCDGAVPAGRRGEGRCGGRRPGPGPGLRRGGSGDHGRCGGRRGDPRPGGGGDGGPGGRAGDPRRRPWPAATTCGRWSCSSRCWSAGPTTRSCWPRCFGRRRWHAVFRPRWPATRTTTRGLATSSVPSRVTAAASPPRPVGARGAGARGPDRQRGPDGRSDHDVAKTHGPGRVVDLVQAASAETRMAHLVGHLAEQPVVRLVELAGVSGADGLLPEVAAVLGVRPAVYQAAPGGSRARPAGAHHLPRAAGHRRRAGVPAAAAGPGRGHRGLPAARAGRAARRTPRRR